MANVCELCGKGRMSGYAVSHSKRRTKKVSKPNIHKVRIKNGSSRKKIALCSSCLKKAKSSSTPQPLV